MIKTTATKKIFNLNKRIRVVSGGSSASKTISILIWCIKRAQFPPNKEAETISVVSETFPHLKRGAMRDFLNIMEEHKVFKPERWNKTDCIYEFESGSKIEFFSADQPGKVRGPRRDVLFINEANNVTYEVYTQLEIRTNKIIWLDYNPVQEFWVYTEVKDKDNVDFITLTYKDNEALPPLVVASLESRQMNKNWWRVYGLGELGLAEEIIYPNWKTDIDEIPHEARLVRRGLDFGYTNDPSALVAVYYYNGGYILDEELYMKGLSNQRIAETIKNLPYYQTVVIADSAEPKSIDELKLYGLNVLPTVKGRDSVLQGIQFVQNQQISVTKRSTNLIHERKNYLWEKDDDSKILNVPTEVFNHCMDAIRYAFEGLRPNDNLDEEIPDDSKLFQGGYY